MDAHSHRVSSFEREQAPTFTERRLDAKLRKNSANNIFGK